MKRGPKKFQRQKDVTSDFLSGNLDEDRLDSQQKFNKRQKFHQSNKTLRTAVQRADESAAGVDIDSLPIAQVEQVYSKYCLIEHEAQSLLAVVRKTLSSVSETAIIVGDFVRFRTLGLTDEAGREHCVIEAALPRRTVLTRADSFNSIRQHPIVANADQMLIVASLAYPKVKWGLVDRMIVAARAGGLSPVVCLNKIDFADEFLKESTLAREVLQYYREMNITTIETSVEKNIGVESLAGVLKDRETVLAGHSGVGKSSLIRAIQPDLDIRIGDISGYTLKGKHTTTSARRYRLAQGGIVIDTPGVKLFGLWNVSGETLGEYFPDVAAGNAPQWRIDSYERIRQSLDAT